MPKADAPQKPGGSSSSAEQTADPGKNGADGNKESSQELQHDPSSFRRIFLKVCTIRHIQGHGEVWGQQCKPGGLQAGYLPVTLTRLTPAMLLPEWAFSPADIKALYPSQPEPSDPPSLLGWGGSDLIQPSVKSCLAASRAHIGPLYGSQTQRWCEPPSKALLLGSIPTNFSLSFFFFPLTSHWSVPQTDFMPGTLT